MVPVDQENGQARTTVKRLACTKVDASCPSQAGVRQSPDLLPSKRATQGSSSLPGHSLTGGVGSDPGQVHATAAVWSCHVGMWPPQQAALVVTFRTVPRGTLGSGL